jgi:L-asparaginase
MKTQTGQISVVCVLHLFSSMTCNLQVTILFNNKLLRGNRSTKVDNSALEAFTSPNMEAMASMDIEINGRQKSFKVLIHWH